MKNNVVPGCQNVTTLEAIVYLELTTLSIERAMQRVSIRGKSALSAINRSLEKAFKRKYDDSASTLCIEDQYLRLKQFEETTYQHHLIRVAGIEQYARAVYEVKCNITHTAYITKRIDFEQTDPLTYKQIRATVNTSEYFIEMINRYIIEIIKENEIEKSV